MADGTDWSAHPERLGYATHHRALLARIRAASNARRALVDARAAHATVMEQVIYASLLEGDSVREIARTYDIPKSEVGRIARRVRDLPADSISAARGPREFVVGPRRAQLLNELWSGADAAAVDPREGER